MKLEDIKSIKSAVHTVQKCQRICAIVLEDGSESAGIYDESNGHWLTLMKREEVGYMSVFNNKKILYATAFN